MNRFDKRKTKDTVEYILVYVVATILVMAFIVGVSSIEAIVDMIFAL